MSLTKVSYSMIDGAPANVLDFGADPTGILDCSAAFLLANAVGSGLVIPSGSYFVNTNTTFTAPVTMMPDAVLNIATGVTVSFNDAFDCGLTKAFKLTGTGKVAFGAFSVSKYLLPQWWGALGNADYGIDGTGNDDTSAINAALAAAGATAKQSKSVFLPDGVYRITSQISVPAGVTFFGTGKWSSILCRNSGSDFTSVKTISIAGYDSPAKITSMGIVSGANPALGTAIDLTALSSSTSDIWINGHTLGIAINTTTCNVYDFIIEICTTGILVSAKYTVISTGLIYSCALGVVVFSSVPQVENGSVLISGVNVLYIAQKGFSINFDDVTINGCSFTNDNQLQTNVQALEIIGTSSNILVTNNDFVITPTISSGASGPAIGVSITTSGQNISVNSNQIRGFQYGIFINSSGVQIVLNSNTCNSNSSAGIYVQKCNFILMVGNTVSLNGVYGIFYSDLSTATQRAIISGTNAYGGGVQVNAVTVVTTVASVVLVTGTITFGNTGTGVTAGAGNLGTVTIVNQI